MGSKSSVYRLAVILCTWLLSSPLCAQESPATPVPVQVPAVEVEVVPSALRVNGFGTLGMVRSGTNFEGVYRRDVSQSPNRGATSAATDSRVGIQANYALNGQFELVGQLVAKERALSNRPRDALEWAFLSYRPTADTTLRVGRTSPDLFLLSDYRNVGFAYVAARPPVDFYGVLPLGPLDGVDVTKSWISSDAAWRAKAFWGRNYDPFQRPSDVARKADLRGVYGLVLSGEYEGFLGRATLARSRVDFKSVQSQLQPLNDGLDALTGLPVPSVAAEAQSLQSRLKFSDIFATYTALGVAYDRASWLVNAEALRTLSNAPSVELQAGYVMLGRRLGKWTVHGTLSAVRTVGSAPAAPQWADSLSSLASVLGPNFASNAQFLGSAAVAAINSGRSQQSTVSLGARWDFDPRIALKLQWDRVRVAPNGGFIMSGKSSGGVINAGTVLLDFVF